MWWWYSNIYTHCMFHVQIELAGQARTYWGHRAAIQTHSLWMQSAALLQLPLGLSSVIWPARSGDWSEWSRVHFQLHSITKVRVPATLISIAERLGVIFGPPNPFQGMGQVNHCSNYVRTIRSGALTVQQVQLGSSGQSVCGVWDSPNSDCWARGQSVSGPSINWSQT